MTDWLTLTFASNVVGVAGVSLLLLAFFLVSTNRVTGQDWRFHALNGVGAFLHLLSLYVFWNLASFIIEIFWIAISCYGLWQAFKKHTLSKA